MKKYINRLAILSGCVMAITACDDNSWNDKLDGFEESVPTDVQTINYTMTQVDYATLASLSSAKALAGDENAAALKAVGSQGYFTSAIDPTVYIPLFLEQERFPYFALSNNSVVRVTYATTGEQPAAVTGAVNAEKYTVSTADYQTAWGSEEDYTEAFAPSATAARNIPKILAAQYPDAEAGDYVIVNYNQSATDPVFNTPEEPSFTPSSVLGNLASMSINDALEFDGVVMALSTQGPVIADATGSIFTYQPSNNSSLNIGDQVSIESKLGAYGNGYQVAKGAEAVVNGNQSVTYPTAKTWTGDEITEFVNGLVADSKKYFAPIYSKFTGTVTVSGNYINIVLDGTTVQLSPYGASNSLKAMLPDGSTVTLEGYVVAQASKGKFLNTVITKVGSTPINSLAAANAAVSRAVNVASTAETAIYTFDGSDWSSPSDMKVLTHADYQAMGQSYDNLSGNGPKQYLPTYLRQQFPYAQTDDVRFVVYNYYNGSETVIRCAECRYDGSEWIGNFDGATIATAQFVKKNGTWMYSPDVTITLPAGRGIEISTLYYQTCVDWIAANVTDGTAYVTSYGNNEYYCGTSAYQGNVDLRPTAFRTQYAGYESMSDEQIVALAKKRFETEVFPAALAILNPDAAPTSSGIQPLYTINFYYYDGTTTAATIVYRVTAPSTFQFVSCTWND